MTKSLDTCKHWKLSSKPLSFVAISLFSFHFGIQYYSLFWGLKWNKTKTIAALEKVFSFQAHQQKNLDNDTKNFLSALMIKNSSFWFLLQCNNKFFVNHLKCTLGWLYILLRPCNEVLLFGKFNEDIFIHICILHDARWMIWYRDNIYSHCLLYDMLLCKDLKRH